LPENLFDLSGKVALVTGGNSGLGLAMAEGLARAGADVVIWGRRESRNATAADQLKRFGTRISHRAVDVTDSEAVRQGFAAAVEEFGRVDCLVANAGIVTPTPVYDMTDEIWHGLLATNLHGVFYACREAARHMRDRSEAGDRGGSIIINGSLAIHAGVPTMEHYAAAKGGLNAMSKSLTVELGEHEVRVNVICPGYIPTDISTNNDNSALVQVTLARTPIKKLGTPEDLQGIVVYLASDMSKYHSGDTITLDGGMMAQTF